MAHKTSHTEPAELKLPATIVTMIDLSRIERELEAIDEFATQSSVRQVGKQPELPRTSRSLDELAKQNGANLLMDNDRQRLAASLKSLKDTAPVIHISFASDPSASFVAKIINWFRQEIHPHTLLQIGLQPNIAAGCIVRTANKQFDLSLRKHLNSQQKLLISKLSQGD